MRSHLIGEPLLVRPVSLPLTVCAGVPTGSPSQPPEQLRTHVLVVVTPCAEALYREVPTGSPSQSIPNSLVVTTPCAESLYRGVPTGLPSQSISNLWQESLLVRPVSLLNIHVEPETACLLL